MSRTYTSSEATFTASRGFNNRTRVSVMGPAYAFYWDVEFSAGPNTPLLPGHYLHAVGLPFTQFTGLSVSGNSRGCGQVTGRFVVLEAVYAADGSVFRLAVDFEQHCDDAAPALFGAVRFNSTISNLIPFGGSYPNYQLTITPDAHGTVTGPGLACGAGQIACGVTYSAMNVTALTAVPEPGYVFTGWTGGCEGGASTSVRVNTIRACAATFGPQIPAGPRTLLFWENLAADVASSGRGKVLSPANSIWTPQLWGSGGVRFVIVSHDPAEDFRTIIEIAPPPGGALTPGLELPITALRAPGAAAVCISANSRYCGTVSGRIRIFDVSLAPDGTPLRFAADIEQHSWNDGIPGLFVALRYNTEVEHTVPFFGAYPSFRVTITPPSNGRVTGPGLSCGGGATSCQLVSPTATSVSLTAEPDSGFAFGGWTGWCRSTRVSFTLAVDSDKTCGVAFVPVVPVAARTLVVLDKQPNGLGPPTRRVLSDLNSLWRVTQYNGRNTLELQADVIEGTSLEYWSFQFKAPDGLALAPGVYEPATRAALTSGAGLDIVGEGACDRVSGRFVVLDIAFAPDGSLTRFAADAEQHCNDATAGLFVAVRYNSLAPGVTAFDGDFPKYQLTLQPPSHGRIVGSALACGGGQSSCSVTFGAATPAVVTALPDPGFIFSGWTGACSGGSGTVTVNVNMPKSCGASFMPTRPVSPVTLLYWDSEPGDEIGLGQNHVFADNSLWTVSASGDGREIAIAVRTPGDVEESRWYLNFYAAVGSRLTPGTYTFGPVFDWLAARLDVIGNGRSCLTATGSFTIRELRLSGTTVEAFAVDFERRCRPSAPALRGRLRINSTIPVWSPRRAADFDGDGKADFAIFRPSNGVWYTRTLAGTAWALQWGAAQDIPVAGDYDGDGRADLAVFRPASGTWYMTMSSTGVGVGRLFGTATDLPVPGDYDGDGKDDLATFTPSSGTWSLQRSSLGATSVGWGIATDRPVAADYDGDGAADVAVFRPSNGAWYVIPSSIGAAFAVQWGITNDVPVPADYDGDGRADLAVFRPSTGTWYVIRSSTGAAFGVQWGAATDVPVPADYDGDGRADLAVFRPADGTWYVVGSSTGAAFGLQWGSPADIPARVQR